jgi:hypothetical protein
MSWYSIIAEGAEEKRCYEWFKCRTWKKIPGAFVLSFWDTPLLQMSVKEPAVLHALITLTSVHKRDILDSNRQNRSDNTMDEQERFMLQHYTRAISHLKPHFLSKDSSSVHIALITCVVFICLELLRGHFRTAQIHLQNGLKVLREMRGSTSANDDGLILLKPSRDPIDDRIAEAFCRLQFQVLLFNQTHQHPLLIVQDSCEPGPILIYRSLNEAWKQMERLFNKIFHLIKQASQQRESECVSFRFPPALLVHQQQIQAELAQWLSTYEMSRKGLQRERAEGQGYQLLYGYHIMANVMADTCLQPQDESIFDSHTNHFVSMIDQSTNLWVLGSQEGAVSGHNLNMSRSIVDIGWIPPLYYTALKCRIHRVRLQAIRLLESTSHREGIWDAKISACVARKVMKIEEGDFYKGTEIDDDFPLSNAPRLEDLSLPTLPQSYRIHEVHVVLPDSRMDNTFLFYRQKQTNGDWKVLSKEYQILSQRWIDGQTGVEMESANS